MPHYRVYLPIRGHALVDVDAPNEDAAIVTAGKDVSFQCIVDLEAHSPWEAFVEDVTKKEPAGTGDYDNG